jgi:sulfur-carrier protein adenylyltransferase/sulfurtransferase
LLSQEELGRYSRQMIIPGVGREGQEKLANAKVLVIGAGGLGAPALIYLAAAGVGTIGIVDGDTVDLSNLHRQVIHFTESVGERKVASAKWFIEQSNPHVNVIEYPFFLTAENVREIFEEYDLVLNGSDNFPTRYLVNDACVMLEKPLVDAAILKFEGQASVFLPGQGCYRCLYPSPPPAGSVPTCSQAGIFGALAGFMGTLQAVEALKVLLGIGEGLVGRLVTFNLLNGTFRQVKWRRNKECPVCGEHPAIQELKMIEESCSIGQDDLHSWQVDAPAVHSWEGKQPLLIDIREDWEIEMQPAIEGSQQTSYAEVLENLDLDRERSLVFVCSIGLRSDALVKALRVAGYDNVYSLRGGIAFWSEEPVASNN